MKNEKIYVGNSNLRLVLNLTESIENSTSITIQCLPPSELAEDIISLSAYVLQEDYGIVYHDFVNPSIFTEKGVYTFWPEIVFSDGRKSIGTATSIKVYNPGT